MENKTCTKGHPMRLVQEGSWVEPTPSEGGHWDYEAWWKCTECREATQEGAQEAWDALAAENKARRAAAEAEAAARDAERRAKQEACDHANAAWRKHPRWRCYSEKVCPDCGKVVDAVDSSD